MALLASAFEEDFSGDEVEVEEGILFIHGLDFFYEELFLNVEVFDEFGGVV